MKSRLLPEEIPAEVLRDHGASARVNRVWRRIEQDLPARRRRKVRPALLWIPAVSMCTFAAGMAVGARWFAAEAPPPRVVAIEAVPIADTVAGQAPVPPRAGPPERRKKRSHERPKPHKAVPAASATAPPVLVEPTEIQSAEPTAALVPEWQQLADDGRYVEALASVERLGGFDAVLSQATAEQLMLLVDVARGTGQRERAILALRRVVSQHGSDPNAPVAAWMLGNELVKAGDAEGAAQAFAMYRALSPQGDFAEDALARQFEVAVEQADVERARRYAEQYAKDFPEGPRGEDIRIQLAELQHRELVPPDTEEPSDEDDPAVENPAAVPLDPAARPDSDPVE